MALRLAVALLGIALIASHYVTGAIASVGEDFQPGVNRVRMPFVYFELSVLAIVVVSGAASFLPSTRFAAARVSLLFSCTCVGAAIFAFVLFVAAQQVEPCFARPPADRVLGPTLRHSFLCPTLSNRSYAGPFYTMVLVSPFLLLANARRRRPAANAV